MTIRILLSKVVEKQKTKTDRSNFFFNVVGKRKTKTESRIPFSGNLGKRKTKLEVGSITSRCSGKEPALLPRTHGWTHGLSIVNFDQ